MTFRTSIPRAVTPVADNRSLTTARMVASVGLNAVTVDGRDQKLHIVQKVVQRAGRRVCWERSAKGSHGCFSLDLGAVTMDGCDRKLCVIEKVVKC